MKTRILLLLLCAIFIIIITGCNKDGDVSDTDIVSGNGPSWSDLPSGGWTGSFESPDENMLQTIDIVDNGDGTITFNLYAQLFDAQGKLENASAVISVSQDGEEAIFQDGVTGYTLRISLSPKRVFVSTMTPDINNPFCDPGVTFDGAYNRLEY